MSKQLSPYEALQKAVTTAGSQSALARELGVSQTAVWKWLQKSKQLPAEYVLTAERLYGVSRHLLRPDIYPIDLPPFAPHAETITALPGNDPCERQTNLQRGEEVQPKSSAAPTTSREEKWK